MPYRGHSENGAVMLDEPAAIPEGAEVSVELVARLGAKPEEDVPVSDYDRLGSLIGKTEGLPSDLAENHDHYLHGQGKK